MILNKEGIIKSPTEPVKNRRRYWNRKSKNLCTALEVGGFTDDGALKELNTRIRTSEFIHVQPGIEYIINVIEHNIEKGTVKINILYYDKNRKFISTSSWKDNNYILTVPENAYYMNLLFYLSNSTTQELTLNDITKAQVEKGNVATSYEPYVKETIFELNKDGQYEELEEIRELKDEIEILKQNYIKHYNIRIKDSQFNDLSTVLSEEEYKSGKVYIITNNPIADGNYIQNGTTHTIIGMQYGDNMEYGFQLSMSGAGMKFRIKWSGTWNAWTTK